MQTESAADVLPRLKRLLAEERAALPPGTLVEADTLNALGAAYFHSGDRAAARRSFEESAGILEKAGSAGQAFKLTVLGNERITKAGTVKRKTVRQVSSKKKTSR